MGSERSGLGTASIEGIREGRVECGVFSREVFDGS